MTFRGSPSACRKVRTFDVRRVRRNRALRRSTLVALVVAASSAPLSLRAQDSVLTLASTIRLALRNSPEVQARRFAIEQANARVAQARSAFLPSLNGVLGNRQRTFNSAELGIAFPVLPGQRPLFDPNGEVVGPINIYDARVRLSQQLYSPVAQAQLQSSARAADAVAAESNAAQARVALEAAIAFVQLQRARMHVAARMEDSLLAAELLASAREQLRTGVGVTLDVTRAESRVVNASSQLVAARADAARASLELSRIAGVELSTNLRTDSLDSDSSAPAVSLQDAIRQATSNRPELRAIDSRVAAFRQQLRSVNAERLPALSLFADNGMIGRRAEDLRYTYNWGLQLSVPLFESRRNARVTEQSAAVRELQEQRRDLERRIGVEVHTALIDLDAASSQTESARSRLTLGARELQQARDRFEAGIASNLDVINASLTLNAARSAMVDALAAQQAARISLAHAQGTLTELR